MTELATIWDSFTTDDPITRRDLKRLGTLLRSDIFLKGLGVHAEECSIPGGFPVVTDIARAAELNLPQDLWDLPEPWPYQEIVGVVEEEAGRIYYRTEISEQSRMKMDELRNAFFRKVRMPLMHHIDATYEKHGVINYLTEKSLSAKIDEARFKSISFDWFTNNIDGFIAYIAEIAFYGGIHKSPIFERMLEAYETGGFPCGWLGPLPEDGGDPVEAVAVFHLGKRSESVEIP